MPTFALHDVTLGYDGHPAVHHLHGEVGAGSLTAVIGPNGSGKSTLMKGLSGLLHPMDGHIELTGCKPQDVAYLPQASEIDKSFPANVTDLVSMGLWRLRGLFAGFSNRDIEAVEKALQAVGLQGFADRGIDTLSGGQLQRALFARVLLQDARVILLDEPFTAIDNRTVADLLQLIHRWHHEKRTVVAVLHDVDMVKANFPDAILLAREPVAWGPTADVLSPANLLKARSMNEAWDEQAPHCERHVA
jgi:zinc/manganese transport system ATP-binding protein